ncbi:hypothetical protein SG34_032905 [Thalassomonas viridans]|uniref:Uncharacterized protein n=1 Tax=Thalassomonas viridans TaxID=137584 RepID=A0AAE9Z9G0_9GAMM|nr:hypothetical protein [Thalassomonas viridans]WDE08707.1 hypothetical protein SG34_032905 [Thalassomonas viridans]
MSFYGLTLLINLGFYFVLILFAFLMVRGMYRLVIWSKRMPKGAFLFLAVFPVLSVFPIPAQEIKKLEKIKQEQLREEDESGEPKEENQDKVSL